VTVVVQKYGGSSLAGVAKLDLVAERVAHTRSAIERVVVVVSARYANIRGMRSWKK